MTATLAETRVESPSEPPTGTRAADPVASQPVALVDLLDRLLGTGVVLSGDVTISLAGVDLVHVSLRALITSVRAEMTGLDAPEGRRP